jgi:hypothetical protein
VSTRSYTTIDKSGWPRGEWDHEPDKVQWIDEATGLDCLAVRQPRLGHWCGYVGLPPGHGCHGEDEGTVCVAGDGGPDHPDVHGGLTYASACQEGDDESSGICHVPAPGRPADVWWLGFDCAHSGDFSPGAFRVDGSPYDHGTYCDLGYVRWQVKRLAGQLAGGIEAQR